MTSNPWSKFFWNDYENDPELKLCSLAAQGLWMRLLCLAAKASPTGYLVTAGRPLTTADIAQLVGKPLSEVETLVDELERNEVFSRDRRGVIFNRRMIRDAKRSQEGRKNAKKRWRQDTEITEEKRPPNGDSYGIPKGDPTPHKPAAKSQKNNRDKPGEDAAREAAAAIEVIEAFDAAIVTAFGPQRARPYPNATDMIYAERWLSEGIGIDVCRSVFQAICARKAKAAAGPPGMLKYCDQAVREAARSATSPARSSGRGGYDPSDGAQWQRSERHADRVKKLLAHKVPLRTVLDGGDWGTLSDEEFAARLKKLVGDG